MWHTIDTVRSPKSASWEIKGEVAMLPRLGYLELILIIGLES